MLWSSGQKKLDPSQSERQNKFMETRFNKVKKLLIHHREDLSRLGARHLAIFGSIARNEVTEDSDVDILVDFDSKKGLFEFMDLKFYLEDLLACDVDLGTKQSLHPALKEIILSEAKEIF